MSKLLLKNCILLDNSKKHILIEDGKIKRITDEPTVCEKDITTININEKRVVPGFIDCHTHLGIIEEGTGKIGIDNNEKSNPVTPHLRGIDAINPFDIAFIDKDYLKEKEIPVAFDPMLTPRIKMELKQRSYSSAVELVEAGVKVAMITDHPYNSIDQLRTVILLAVSEGLNPLEAINCITVHPAEILGCSDRIGKIKEGYDADLAVFNGNPFDLNSKVVITFINGNVVFHRE